MNVREKILIIGNGFDLAHFLPTKYEHFIHAMKVVEGAAPDTSLSFENLYKDLLGSEDYILIKCKELHNTEELGMTMEQVNRLKDNLVNNSWFQFFKSQIDSGIDTWIDFENEVKHVLDSLCSLINEIEEDVKHFQIASDKNVASIKAQLITEKMFRKHPALTKILWQFDIIEKRQPSFSEQLTLNKDFIKYYHKRAVYLDTNRIFGHLTKQWNGFIEIFSMYIEYIDTFKPKKKLNLPKVLLKDECTIYSFNYSSTVERFYNNSSIQFLHGRTGENNTNTIVLGISVLENKILVKEKAYGFVKYYQKLVNSTDYQFLRGNPDITDLEREKIEDGGRGESEIIEIYLWGHSLDSSDSDYIEEIFGFNQGSKPSINVIVYYFGSPHAQLANLIFIMGRDIIEKWMKEGWLEFVESPDIYRLNTDEGYKDKLSKKSEKKPRKFFSQENEKSIFSDI